VQLSVSTPRTYKTGSKGAQYERDRIRSPGGHPVDRHGRRPGNAEEPLKILVIEYMDGQVEHFGPPVPIGSAWWHGPQDNYPGVYVVLHSYKDKTLIPLVSIRRITEVMREPEGEAA
jgi:hypothetical protein